MRRRNEKLLLHIALASLAGVAALSGVLFWYLWRESVTAEEQYVGGLAATLGEYTESAIRDVRNILQLLDKLPDRRCSKEHLRALEEVAIGRTYIKAIGYWRAAERQCGVGFLQAEAPRPPRADNIYKSGFIAWWPSEHTEVGGVKLFIMRYGDHDIAIDPTALFRIATFQHREASLWMENRLLTSQPSNAVLPPPDSLRVGLQLDRARQIAVSRYSRPGEFRIEVVAVEPLGTFWGRYASTLLTGAVTGLVLLGIFVYGIIKYMQHRMSIATLMREAIAKGRITAQYQPIVDLRTGRIAGAEALARWQLEDNDWVSPDVFIPIAEREGLIPDITRTMLAAPLRELRGLLIASPHLTVNVNVSAIDVSSDSFIRMLVTELSESGISSKSIKLEITERALVDTDAARELIRKVRALGHEVAVDDFGTGYSSLSYLSTFELDWLKIDKSFVDAIGTESATSQVITHVIEMARSLNLRLVAEGVETEEQVRWLLQHGVDYGQGYYFNAPMSAKEFTELCAQEAVFEFVA